MFEALTKYLEKIDTVHYGDWVIDKKSKGTPADPIQMPFVDYSSFVMEFVKQFYNFEEDHPEYGLSHYYDILQEADLSGQESIDVATLGTLDARTVLALILQEIRADRFCEGALLDAFEDGRIKQYLLRLKAIDEAATDEMKPVNHISGSIEIHKNGITHLKTDAVVNAANSGLCQGGGVCGAIFKAAGEDLLKKACDQYDHCPSGSAVITPAFNMKNNKYIIHAVGPRYTDGRHGEKEELYSCYHASLQLAMENGCHSIGFPLISAGIFGYPLEEAWKVAIDSCADFLRENADYRLKIIFVNPNEETLAVGKSILKAAF